MRRTLLLLALLALPLGACGTAGGPGGFFSTFAGPIELALPIFDDGAAKILVLRNLVGTPARLRVRWAATGGGGPPDTLIDATPIAARGERRLVVPIIQGWAIVDTRDPITAAPIATTGFVEPYLRAQRSGPDEENSYAAVFQQTDAVLPIHPRTDQVLLLNHGPAPATFTVREFASNGTELLPNTPYMLAVDDSTLVLLPNLTGTIGHLHVTANVAGTLFTLAGKEDTDLVYEVDDRVEEGNGVNEASRLLDRRGTTQAELMLEFGRDNASGGYVDFEVLVSNVTNTSTSFTIRSIYDEFGNAIKTTPRTFNLPARSTRLFATTLVDTLGLEVGEVHPFQEHFGDVFLSAGLRRFRMDLNLSEGMFLTARQFDPLTLDFAAGVRPIAARRTTSVFVNELQTSLLGGIANYADLSNPSANPITVQVRAFTPERGTEYIVTSLTIPPRGIVTFRGDALHLKEEPNTPSLADVSHLRFLFSSNSPFGTRGRREARNGSGLLVFVTPHIIRHEE